MELQIIAKDGLFISDTVEEYARKKIGKLSRYWPTIGEGKVEISQKKSKLPQQKFTVQVTLDSKGTLIRAQERSQDIRTAIDSVVDALTRQIERYKGKQYDKGRGISLARQGAPVTEEESTMPQVVKSKHFIVKPMSQTEAICQMELLGHDFFLFIDAAGGNSNLLYRRKDGNYGLIEMEEG